MSETFPEKMKRRFKKWMRLRFAAFYPFVVYAIFFLNSDDASLRVGVPIVMLGEVLRLWANGYAIKMDKLTTCGPYAYVRNPLYVGTLLIAMGFCVVLRTWIAGIVFFLLLAFLFWRTTLREEQRMAEHFPVMYAEYRKQVPRFFPRLTPCRIGETWPFSFGRLIYSQEYKPVLWIVITLLAIYLKEELVAERGSFAAKQWLASGAIAILIMVDIISEYFLRRAKKQVSHS